jgi:hypothetical protein
MKASLFLKRTVNIYKLAKRHNPEDLNCQQTAVRNSNLTSLQNVRLANANLFSQSIAGCRSVLLWWLLTKNEMDRPVAWEKSDPSKPPKATPGSTGPP